jgi:glycerol-3-phosphate acyltransferase PlsY
MKLFGLLFFAYLLGSVPFGLVLTKIFTSEDIRQKGSGNVGATNVRRVAGTTLGMFTLAGDVFKGALPVYLAGAMTGSDNLSQEIYMCSAALLAFSGHLYPIFLKFKDGGKGVATAAVLSPTASIIAVTVFVIFILLTNYVSVGSLAAAAILPIAVLWFTRSWIISGCAIIITILIYFRHRDNIKRLLKGIEPVIWKRKRL